MPNQTVPHEGHNLARLVFWMALKIEEEDIRERVLEEFRRENPVDADMDLLGRDGNDILFRVANVVFHVPILQLTAPPNPGAN